MRGALYFNSIHDGVTLSGDGDSSIDSNESVDVMATARHQDRVHGQEQASQQNVRHGADRTILYEDSDLDDSDMSDEEFMRQLQETEREIREQLSELRNKEALLVANTPPSSKEQIEEPNRQGRTLTHTSNLRNGMLSDRAVDQKQRGRDTRSQLEGNVSATTKKESANKQIPNVGTDACQERQVLSLSTVVVPQVRRWRSYQDVQHDLLDDGTSGTSSYEYLSAKQQEVDKDSDDEKIKEQVQSLRGELKRISSLPQLILSRQNSPRNRFVGQRGREPKLAGMQRNHMSDEDGCNGDSFDTSGNNAAQDSDLPAPLSARHGREIGKAENLEEKIERLQSRIQDVGSKFTPIPATTSKRQIAERSLLSARTKFQKSKALSQPKSDSAPFDSAHLRPQTRGRPLRYDREELRRKEALRSKLVKRMTVKKRQQEKLEHEERLKQEMERQRRLELLEQQIRKRNRLAAKTNASASRKKSRHRTQNSSQKREMKGSQSTHKRRNVEFCSNKLDSNTSRPTGITPWSINDRKSEQLRRVPNSKGGSQAQSTLQNVTDSEDERELAMKRAQRLALRTMVKQRRQAERDERRRRWEEEEARRKRRESVSALLEKIRLGRADPKILTPEYRHTVEQMKRRSTRLGTPRNKSYIMESTTSLSNQGDIATQWSNRSHEHKFENSIEPIQTSFSLEHQLRDLEALEQAIRQKREELVHRHKVRVGGSSGQEPEEWCQRAQVSQMSNEQNRSVVSVNLSSLLPNNPQEDVSKNSAGTGIVVTDTETRLTTDEEDIGSIDLNPYMESLGFDNEDKYLAPPLPLDMDQIFDEIEQSLVPVAEHGLRVDAIPQTAGDWLLKTQHSDGGSEVDIEEVSPAIETTDKSSAQLVEPEIMDEVPDVQTKERGVEAPQFLPDSDIALHDNFESRDHVMDDAEDPQTAGMDDQAGDARECAEDNASHSTSFGPGAQEIRSTQDGSDAGSERADNVLMESRPVGDVDLSDQSEQTPEQPGDFQDEQAGLHASQTLLKFTRRGGKGKPHERFFFVDRERRELCWSDKPTGGRIRTVQIVKVTRGLQTIKRNVNDDINGRGFTVDGVKRSVYIVAPDVSSRNKWVDTLQRLVEQGQEQDEQSRMEGAEILTINSQKLEDDDTQETASEEWGMLHLELLMESQHDAGANNEHGEGRQQMWEEADANEAVENGPGPGDDQEQGQDGQQKMEKQGEKDASWHTR